MNQKQFLTNQFSPIYFEGGLLIIGRTGSGKTTFLIQSLEELRERKDYRVVMFNSFDERVYQKLYRTTDQHVENLTTTELQEWTGSADNWLWLNQSTFPLISPAEMRQQFCHHLSRVIDNWQVEISGSKTIFVLEQPLDFPAPLVSLIKHGVKGINNFDCVLVTQELGDLLPSDTSTYKMLLENLTHRLVFDCDPVTSEHLAAGSKMHLRVLSNLSRGQAIMFQRNEIVGRVQINIVHTTP